MWNFCQTLYFPAEISLLWLFQNFAYSIYMYMYVQSIPIMAFSIWVCIYVWYMNVSILLPLIICQCSNMLCALSLCFIIKCRLPQIYKCNRFYLFTANRLTSYLICDIVYIIIILHLYNGCNIMALLFGKSL